MRVVHCFTVELRAMFRWPVAACGHWPVITLTKVETMIDVSVEMFRPVVPSSRPDEYAA
jgi:hypothetical protein